MYNARGLQAYFSDFFQKRTASTTQQVAVLEDEFFHPMHVDFFSAQAIVKIPNALPNLIQKAD